MTGRESRPEAIRIEVEFADGRVQRAVGPDADTIWKALMNAIVFQTIHGMPYIGPQMADVDPTELRPSGWPRAR